MISVLKSFNEVSQSPKLNSPSLLKNKNRKSLHISLERFLNIEEYMDTYIWQVRMS